MSLGREWAWGALDGAWLGAGGGVSAGARAGDKHAQWAAGAGSSRLGGTGVTWTGHGGHCCAPALVGETGGRDRSAWHGCSQRSPSPSFLHSNRAPLTYTSHMHRVGAQPRCPEHQQPLRACPPAPGALQLRDVPRCLRSTCGASSHRQGQTRPRLGTAGNLPHGHCSLWAVSPFCSSGGITIASRPCSMWVQRRPAPRCHGKPGQMDQLLTCFSPCFPLLGLPPHALLPCPALYCLWMLPSAQSRWSLAPIRAGGAHFPPAPTCRMCNLSPFHIVPLHSAWDRVFQDVGWAGLYCVTRSREIPSP